ncbi:MAG TPA: OsmC family protein [Thermoleophilia bacterium]|nr:OsmC family protein [Thermoleophilia bacterium]
MPSELSVHAVQHGPMRFAISDGDHEVTVDYPLPGGDGDLGGMTPLRLLLASLAGCSGSAVAALLRRDGQPVERVEVTARGRRRDEHPTVITDIDLAFVVHGAVDPARVEHALALSEAQICPVWAMLKAGTPVSSSYAVVTG